METKECKYCKEKINKEASVCPNCKKDLNDSSLAKAIIVIVSIVALAICFGKLTNKISDGIDEISNDIEQRERAYFDINGKTQFKVNETFESKKVKITMTKASDNFTKAGTAGKNKKIVMAYFVIENLEDDSLYVDKTDFKCYADGAGYNVVTQIFDKGYDELPYISISKNKKAKGYIFYEVPKSAKNIVLEYTPYILKEEEKINFIIK